MAASPLSIVAESLRTTSRITSRRFSSARAPAVRAVRGTRDAFPDSTGKTLQLIEQFQEIVRTYGYGAVETPILENTALFARGLGDGSDVVSKEMFTFTPWQASAAAKEGDPTTDATPPSRKAPSRDADTDESLTLRPEGTAGILRAAIQGGLLPRYSPAATGPGTFAPPSLPLRLYYHGPMFRYERPQRGRYRQFTQLGVERLGGGTRPSALVAADVEVVTTALELLTAVLPLAGTPDVDNLPAGVSPLRLKLLINSLGGDADRAAYTAALRSYLAAHEQRLSSDSKARLARGAVLRVLDSKAEEDQAIIAGAPPITEYLSGESRAGFEDVLAMLHDSLPVHASIASPGAQSAGAAGLGPAPPVSIVPEPRLVRGLDYYSGLIFEFVAEEVGPELCGRAGVGSPAAVGQAQSPVTAPESTTRAAGHKQGPKKSGQPVLETPKCQGHVGTVLAGGRYDRLPSILGYRSSPCPCVGWAAGLERLTLLTHWRPEQGPDSRGPTVAIVPVLDKIGPAKASTATQGGKGAAEAAPAAPAPAAQAAASAASPGPSSVDGHEEVGSKAVTQAAAAVAQALRSALRPPAVSTGPAGGAAAAGIPQTAAQPFRVITTEGGVPLKRSLPAVTSELGARVALIMGSSELEAGLVVLKDLARGQQQSIPVPGLAPLYDRLRGRRVAAGAAQKTSNRGPSTAEEQQKAEAGSSSASQTPTTLDVGQLAEAARAAFR